MWKFAVILLALWGLVPAGYAGTLPTNEIQLTFSSGMSPSFSPDGARIVYSSMRSGELDIWAMDRDGANQISLTSDIHRDMQPVFSPDGSRILYVSQRFERQNIWVMDADGGNKRQLGQSDMWEGSPQWSPDGRRIAYMAGKYPDYDIWIMDADGSNERRLTFEESGERTPQWSPDGERIAYVSDGPDGYEIKVMDADGRNSRTLVTDAYWKGQLSWGRNGKIAFVSRQSGDYDIWIMSADGMDVRRLTSNRFWQTSPSLSPDGNGIVYASDQSGTSEVWIKYTTAPAPVEKIETLPVPAVEMAPAIASTESVSTASEPQDERQPQKGRHDYVILIVLPFMYLLMSRWRLKCVKLATDGNHLS